MFGSKNFNKIKDITILYTTSSKPAIVNTGYDSQTLILWICIEKLAVLLCNAVFYPQSYTGTSLVNLLEQLLQLL